MKPGPIWIKQNNTGATALMFASGHGHTKVVRLLIKARANKDIKNNHGETALMIANARGRKAVVELLQ